MRSRIITFKGILNDGEQQTLRMGTHNGKVGYRIIKFQGMARRPYAESSEHILKIYKYEQDTVDGLVNFDDQTLIGASIINNHSSGYSDPSVPTIIVDHVKVNQDLFITHSDIQATEDCNYYIELEQFSLSTDEAAVATLKDMRGSN